MIDPKRFRNSFTMAPESTPAGAQTAVRAPAGEPGANSASPSSRAAARVARASNWAFSIRFSRPISRLEYILGKSVTVWWYLLLISTAPALALYVLAVLLSPSISVVAYTWDIPFRVLAATAVLLIPTTAMALAFSSLTRHIVTAGFLWYAVWIVGGMAHGILYMVDQIQAIQAGQTTFDWYRWDLISL